MGSKWKLPILLSFAYYKDELDLKKLAKDVSLIIDSGAFSIKNSGKKIYKEDYAEFLKYKLPKGIPYFNFDVIGESKASFKNFLYLRRQGLRPIPIVTKDDDIPMIEKYYKMHHYVGYGGLKDADMGISVGDRKHVKWLMNQGCKGRPCHWLGFCNIDFIKYYRPTSCDSLTWKQAQIYGKIYVLTETGMHLLSRKEILNASIPIRNSVQSLGFDIGDLYDKDNWYGTNHLAQFISCCMYIRFTNLIEKKTGTKMHLVVGNLKDFDILLKAKKYLEKRNVI